MVDELGSRSLFLTVLEAGLMIVLNFVSLLGNILVVMSIYKNTRLRTTTNLYIIALAVSDLLSAMFVMPLSTGVLVKGKWPFSQTVCQIHAFITLFVVYISPVAMGLTAVNRYVRMCKSDQQYKRFFSSRKSRVYLASGWAFVVLYILITRLSGLQEFVFFPGYAGCLNKQLYNIGKIIHYFVVAGLFFILPMAVTVFSYKKVSKKIQEHNMGAAQALHTQAGTTGVSIHEIRVSRSLFVVVFAFMLCWSPTYIIAILSRLGIVANMPRSAEIFCTFCVILSNTINPFIYAGMNPQFRKEFQRILRCECSHMVQNIPQTSNGRPNIFSSSMQAEMSGNAEPKSPPNSRWLCTHGKSGITSRPLAPKTDHDPRTMPVFMLKNTKKQTCH